MEPVINKMTKNKKKTAGAEKKRSESSIFSLVNLMTGFFWIDQIYKFGGSTWLIKLEEKNQNESQKRAL